MAQPISPAVWNKAALEDNRLLPARYSINIFKGKGVNIANNAEASYYDDILVSDAIFDYDDRRLNGLAGVNSEGRDGWGASAYGPFQTVRFTRRVFTMGQHKSIAWRVFEERQYEGEIGNFGTAAKSSAYTGGANFMAVAETINKAKEIWDKQILGPHIDKYNFFAIASGHISGRFVQTKANQGAMFDCEGQWVACPGPYEGVSFKPEFAPIKAVEWDSKNARKLLNAIDVAWTNLFIPETDRVILLDKAYKDSLLSNYIGVPGTVPVTEKAYDDLKDGKFERFMGWDFDFSIPSQYFPTMYLDANNNVVHSKDGTAAYDMVLNSIKAPEGTIKLQSELTAAQRTQATNYIRTVYNTATKKFENVVTNYPFSQAAGSPYFGAPETHLEEAGEREAKDLASFPWAGYPGQGIKSPTGPVAPIRRRKVIGMAVYRPAAQLSEEYGEMKTDEGNTRGKFTELVFDMKHDAWVIPNLSHGIILFVDAEASTGEPAVKIETAKPEEAAAVTGLTATPTTLTLKVGESKQVSVNVAGKGAYDMGWSVTVDKPLIAEVDDFGTVTAKSAGVAKATFASIADATKKVDVTITVS